MVDDSDFEPRVPCGVRLCGEVFVRAASPEWVRGNQKHHARILPDPATRPPPVISRHRHRTGLLVDDLFAEDVRVPAVLGKLAQHVEIHPPDGERAAPVAMDHAVQA
jgi:hypothetical protein